MPGWSKVTLKDARELAALTLEARQFVARQGADGFGVFRAREGFALYYSPIASRLIDPNTGLNVEECLRPDELRVEIVVGPYDDPAWYDQAAERMTLELDLIQLDEMGLIGFEADSAGNIIGETDLAEVRKAHFGR